MSHSAEKIDPSHIERVISDLKAQHIPIGPLKKGGESVYALRQGMRNKTYAFHTEASGDVPAGHYVLSIAPDNTHNTIFKNMGELQHILYDAGVPIAQPIGKVGTLPNGNAYLITQFIKGTQYKGTDLNATHLRALGVALGKLHKASMRLPEADLQADRPLPLGTRLKILGRSSLSIVNSSVEDWPLLDLARTTGRLTTKKISEKLFGKAKLPTGFLHADLNAENIIFEDGQPEKIKIIDLGEFRYGNLLDDLIDVLTACCSNYPSSNHRDGARFNQEKASAFLQGYHSIRPLQPEEVKELPRSLENKVLKWKQIAGNARHFMGTSLPGLDPANPHALRLEANSFYNALIPSKLKSWLYEPLGYKPKSREI